MTSKTHNFPNFYPLHLHTHTFIRNRNEPYLPLPSQPQLVLIYRPRRDGRLSRPWCEVAPAEIRTHNLPIANPALYHTATVYCTALRTGYRVRKAERTQKPVELFLVLVTDCPQKFDANILDTQVDRC